MAGARPFVDQPPFAPLPYGLLSVAELPPSPAHWQNGVTWIERCPTGSTTYDECVNVTGAGSPPAPPAKVDNVAQTFRGATPFTVFTEFDCAPVGLDEALRPNAAAPSASLERVETWQVERAFWTGVAGGQTVVFPHLAEDAAVIDAQGITLQTVPTTGGPFDIAEGLGFLERTLADCYYGVGVIHVPQFALPTLDAWGLVTRQGARLRTLNGNWVAVGAGYTGSAPDGTGPPANSSWIYATGTVFLHRGPVEAFRVRDSIDRAENTVKLIAERTYVVGFDCCHAGVLVSLGVPVT